MDLLEDHVIFVKDGFSPVNGPSRYHARPVCVLIHAGLCCRGQPRRPAACAAAGHMPSARLGELRSRSSGLKVRWRGAASSVMTILRLVGHDRIP